MPRNLVCDLINELRAQGISNKAVLNSMLHIPRELFVAEDESHLAYQNIPLPIERGQTISQPFIVAKMTELICQPYVKKVLEVGTGSGYQTAILASIFPQVFSIERIESLSKQAQKKLQKLNLSNIQFMIGDGHLGAPLEQPFDAILVTAAAKEIPQALIDQLSDPGCMVIPVGEFDQKLIFVEKNKGALIKQNIENVRFVPLLPGIQAD